jgi:hypothetical protein
MAAPPIEPMFAGAVGVVEWGVELCEVVALFGAGAWELVVLLVLLLLLLLLLLPPQPASRAAPIAAVASSEEVVRIMLAPVS